MYHPDLIARRQEALLQSPYGKTFPPEILSWKTDDYRSISEQIQSAYDTEHEGYVRRLSLEEEAFIAMSQLRVQYDAPFYLEVFVMIDEEGHGLRPLFPLWESQKFTLDRLAALEKKHDGEGHPDGLLANVLKARQLGISTLAEALVSHRVFCHPHIRAISGSDVEEQAVYLFKMVERIYAHLPIFLRPAKIVPYKAGKEMNFANLSRLTAAWSKSTRGALQEVGGKKGNLERGRTNSVVHMSELATQDNPEQLDSALLPGIPVSPVSLCLFESTAEIAGDWWHRHWLACEEGSTPRDWANIFIPWCVEPSKYSLPAPFGWTPADATVKVAQTIDRDTERWVGKTLHLNRDQLFWYETTRAYYLKKNQLHQFLKEYPSNPEECFQYAGRSVLSPEQIEVIDQAARKIADVWAVEPSREIAELKRLPDDPRAQALKEDPRPAAPIATKMGTREADLHPVPPGYGFRRISKLELEALPSLRHSVMTIYEYPRVRGRRRYVLGVDVGDGLGLDYSVVSVIREPTIEEPAEEVAQYVSNRLKPSQLASVVDAIGRFYSDEDGVEALAAIELNNHGASVQDLLQLHLGYSNFYVWEIVDAADPAIRQTKKIGWVTSSRTRPLLIEKFIDSITTVDPISGVPDFRLNSPITRSELRFFVTEGLLGEAEHAKSQHDDAIFGSAIGYYVAHRLAGGETEPIAERRRRREALKVQALVTGRRVDYRNSALTADEQDRGVDDEFDGIGDDHDATYFH